MKLILFTVIFSVGLTAQAQSLSSLAGVYSVVDGDHYCSELRSVQVKVNSDKVTIITKSEGFPEGQHRRLEGINSGVPKVRGYLNGTEYERTVFARGTLKIQKKFFVFFPLESRYKDSEIILQSQPDGRVVYHYRSFGDTYCLLEK